ncbi:MAG: hypothetical protein KAW56_15525 [Candidatus Marinimicrobia bacterium]|nr:hypothetical protein [Candidatus Neomarinimicrobiota bacterium]
MKTDIERLQEELVKIEPTIDFLHEVCGCGQYAEITRTSDGFFLGRLEGDCGFNSFLGKPSSIALERTKNYLNKLPESCAMLATKLLAKFGYPMCFTAVKG